jgi:hypothetical protein
MKQMLIITGPQGSGNHLWSKIFALHPEVYGWRALLDHYWLGHDNEPFAELWADPSKIASWKQPDEQYLVTSVSCPYMADGVETIPHYFEVIEAFSSSNIDVKVATISRDQNILAGQQRRIRGKTTTELFEKELPLLDPYNPYFISTETLYLYKERYLAFLAAQLPIPVAFKDPRIAEILAVDANAKYLSPDIPSQLLDFHTRYTSSKKQPIPNLDK